LITGGHIDFDQVEDNDDIGMWVKKFENMFFLPPKLEKPQSSLSKKKKNTSHSFSQATTFYWKNMKFNNVPRMSMN